MTDVLIVNENELADLLPTHVTSGLNDFDQNERGRIAAGLSQLGIEQAVVTLGSRGSLVIEGASTTLVPAIPTDAIDTTGCRDAFFGTVLAAMASGIPLLDACRLASWVSSIAAVGHGAQASYADRADSDLLRIYGQQGHPMKVGKLQLSVIGSVQIARVEPECRRESAPTHVILEFPGGQND